MTVYLFLLQTEYFNLFQSLPFYLLLLFQLNSLNNMTPLFPYQFEWLYWSSIKRAWLDCLYCVHCNQVSSFRELHVKQVIGHKYFSLALHLARIKRGQVDNNNNDGNKIKYFLNVASQIEILFQLTIPNVDLSTNYEI